MVPDTPLIVAVVVGLWSIHAVSPQRGMFCLLIGACNLIACRMDALCSGRPGSAQPVRQGARRAGHSVRHLHRRTGDGLHPVRAVRYDLFKTSFYNDDSPSPSCLCALTLHTYVVCYMLSHARVNSRAAAVGWKSGPGPSSKSWRSRFGSEIMQMRESRYTPRDYNSTTFRSWDDGLSADMRAAIAGERWVRTMSRIEYEGYMGIPQGGKG